MSATRVALKGGLESARAAATSVLERHLADPELAGAVAVNLLMAMGTLLGGWQLAKGALAARSMVDRDGADAELLEAKLTTSEFYAEHFMPRIAAYTATVLAGSRTVMGLSVAQLLR